jgi:hypothetical protein
MTTISENHRLKRLFILPIIILLVLSFTGKAMADHEKDLRTAIKTSPQMAELVSQGYDKTTAEDTIFAAVLDMEGRQEDVSAKYDELKTRVDSLNAKDTRKDSAKKLLDTAKKAKDSFAKLNALKNLVIEVQIGNVPPLTVPSEDFLTKEKEALDALSQVNMILIAPTRPGNVPAGDILEDFVPQLIRQLFRFAWLAIFISFVVSGVMFITSLDNDEQINKAKRMIYFTFLGFAFVTLAFAIVKAITDIDFFGFI